MLKDRKGISPIIGVILVVAMTVLLAVIAWTYLGGMMTSPGKAYIVQPIVTKESPNVIKVRFEGKDVIEVYKVDFSGSTNGDNNPINNWTLYDGSQYIYGNNTGSYNESDTYPNDFNNTYGSKAFTFGETDPDYDAGTVETTLTLQSYYIFKTNQATSDPASNTIMITVTFKDGTTQTFEYKV